MFKGMVSEVTLQHEEQALGPILLFNCALYLFRPTCTTLLCTTVPMELAQSLGPSPLKRPAFPSILMMCFAEV